MQKFLAQNFSWVNIPSGVILPSRFLHSSSHDQILMIIHNLDLVCTVFLPDEAYSVSVIDSDAVLPFSIGLKPFEPVAWRNSKVGQRSGRVN